MLPLDLGQVDQQLPDGRVCDLLCGSLVKLARLQLHRLGLLPHDVDAERTSQPHRPAMDETLDVLAADKRDVLAEALAVQVDEAAAVLGFVLLHLREHGSRGGIRFAQTFDEISVNPAILFFERDCQGEDLTLGQVLEVLRHSTGVRLRPYAPSPLTFSTERKASCGISTRPTRFMRFLPAFCFSSSFRLREMSPP